MPQHPPVVAAESRRRWNPSRSGFRSRIGIPPCGRLGIRCPEPRLAWRMRIDATTRRADAPDAAAEAPDTAAEAAGHDETATAADDLRPAQREARATRLGRRAPLVAGIAAVLMAALLGFVIMARFGRAAVRVRRGVGRGPLRGAGAGRRRLRLLHERPRRRGLRRLRGADRHRRGAARLPSTVGCALLRARVGRERRRRAAAQEPVRPGTARGHPRALRLRLIPVGACRERRDDRGRHRRDRPHRLGVDRRQRPTRCSWR